MDYYLLDFTPAEADYGALLLRTDQHKFYYNTSTDIRNPNFVSLSASSSLSDATKSAFNTYIGTLEVSIAPSVGNQSLSVGIPNRKFRDAYFVNTTSTAIYLADKGREPVINNNGLMYRDGNDVYIYSGGSARNVTTLAGGGGNFNPLAISTHLIPDRTDIREMGTISKQFDASHVNHVFAHNTLRLHNSISSSVKRASSSWFTRNGTFWKDSGGNVIVRTGGDEKSLSNIGSGNSNSDDIDWANFPNSIIPEGTRDFGNITNLWNAMYVKMIRLHHNYISTFGPGAETISGDIWRDASGNVKVSTGTPKKVINLSNVTTSDNIPIPNNSITTAKIKNGAVTTDKLASRAVTSTKLAINSVTQGAMSTKSVGNNALQTGAVTNAKVSTTAAIAVSKLAAGSNGQVIKTIGGTVQWGTDETGRGGPVSAGSITTTHLADGAVTGDKLASNAVTNIKIKNNTISGGKLLNNTVLPTNIKAQNIASYSNSAYNIGTRTNRFDAIWGNHTFGYYTVRVHKRSTSTDLRDNASWYSENGTMWLDSNGNVFIRSGGNNINLSNLD